MIMLSFLLGRKRKCFGETRIPKAFSSPCTNERTTINNLNKIKSSLTIRTFFFFIESYYDLDLRYRGRGGDNRQKFRGNRIKKL